MFKVFARFGRVAVSALLAAVTPWPLPAQAASWVPADGNVQLADGTPLCAMVLANGQYMFSCDGTGSFDLGVPLDSNGQITLFSFADGFAPYSAALRPNNFPFTVFMETAPPNSPLITMSRETVCAERNWVRVTGGIQSLSGDPLCAMVLANGQQMFTCGASLGRYDLTVPPDGNREITIFGFADGFQPHRAVFSAPQCDLLVGTWRSEFGDTITFGSEGTFSNNSCGGFESGTYVYDPAAQSFTSIVATQDNNGECGLADNGVPYLDLSVRREGNRLVVNNGEEFLYKVE